jgi:predicted metal-dependent peptidase
MTNANQETLARAVKELMYTEPFYGLLILSLNKKWDERVKTACVGVSGINFDLSISPTFWEGLSAVQRKGILKHELMHMALFHLTDYRHLTDHRIANIAMDIEINQYIDPTWLPEGHMNLGTFPELKLLPNQGTKYYYDKLKEAKSEALDKIIEAIKNGETECELPDGSTVLLSNHDWEEIDKLDEGTERVIKDQLGGILKRTAEAVEKARGTVPGEMVDVIKALNEVPEPKFDWKGYIRRFAGKSIKVFTKKSRRKLSKRYEDNPGLKIKQKKHILVAIDTSGSVNNAELKEFLQEIHHLQKTGNEVTVIQCDTAISHVGTYKPGEDFKIHGRGGTSFQPVIDYFNEHFNKLSCLIYFTDGEAPSPVNAKGNILWVLSNRSHMNSSLPGAVIKLEL